MTNQEIKKAEANAVDQGLISYIKPPATFENVSTWAGIAVANSWTSYIVVPQPI